MIRVLEHEDLLYKAKFIGLCGTPEEVREYGRKGDSLAQAVANGILASKVAYRGRSLIVVHQSGEMFYVMYVSSQLRGHDRFLVTSHEALHATFSVMERVGMKLADASEEAFTYYHQQLTSLMLTLVMPPKQKRRTRRRRK